MPDTRYPVSGSLRVWFVPLNGIANPKAPTAAEIAAGMDISDAVSWNDKDFGIQASNTSSDPAITARGTTQSRGSAQYGGSFSFYYPKVHNDNTNIYSLVYDALRVPGTAGYIIVRNDGQELLTSTGTATNPGTTIAAGDFVNVFRVETGGYSENITGEDAFRYTISFIPKGLVWTFAIVRSSATPVVPTVNGVSTLTLATKYAALTATVQGRSATRLMVWSSTTPAIATISPNGIITAKTAGSASFLATDPATNTPSAAKAVTIS